MKTTTLLLTLVAGSAFAGEPVSAPSTCAPATTLGEWFVGGTYTNYEGDAEMYALQIGRDLGAQFLGFDTAVYLEAGMYDADSAAADLEVNPFTVNLKLERPLVGPLNLYLTGGVGFATWDLSGGADDDGTSFYAQTSVGVLYNVCERLELFAGGRLAYLEEASDNEIGWEVGGRINF
jgi:opacity protein-like surface antigen